MFFDLLHIGIFEVNLTSLVVHYCRSLSRFPQHEATRSIATPPGWDASPSQVTSQHFVRFPRQFAGTHLYSWVERDTVKVKCLVQEHNTMTRPGLEPGPLDTESSALTTRPPRLQVSLTVLVK